MADSEQMRLVWGADAEVDKGKARGKAGLIIFDFDDTLTDNRGLDHAFYVHLHRRYGLPLMGKRALARLRLRRWRTEKIIGRLVREAGTRPNPEKLLKERLDFFDSEISEHSLKPGVIPSLRHLRKSGYVFALASGRRKRKTVLGLMSALRIRRYFESDLICCMDDLGRRKNHPANFKKEMYRLILKRSRGRFPWVYAVGNLISDLAPARELGLKAVGTPGSYYVQPGLGRIAPIVDGFPSLPKMLAREARHNIMGPQSRARKASR